MPDHDNFLILPKLHAAIEASLRAQFSAMALVEFYPTIGERLPLPAVILEVAEFDQGVDPGTGELALVARVEARVCVDPLRPDADLLVREYAIRLAHFVQHKTWSLPITPAKLVGEIGEDSFKPALDSYTVWLVSWLHEIHVGSLHWPFDDQSGQHVHVAIFPAESASGQGEYEAIAGDAV